jgi:hypothetical protein
MNINVILNNCDDYEFINIDTQNDKQQLQNDEENNIPIIPNIEEKNIISEPIIYTKKYTQYDKKDYFSGSYTYLIISKFYKYVGIVFLILYIYTVLRILHFIY